MLTLEVIENVIEQLGYSSYMISRAIENGALETIPVDRAFSDFKEAITRDSFHAYLYKLGVNPRQIDSIMDYI